MKRLFGLLRGMRGRGRPDVERGVTAQPMPSRTPRLFNATGKRIRDLPITLTKLL